MGFFEHLQILKAFRGNLIIKFTFSSSTSSRIALYSPDTFFPYEIIQRLVYGGKGSLVAHVLEYLFPDAYTISIALELEDGQKDDLFVSSHEFWHGFSQINIRYGY